jgi:hypothetical protein
MHIASCISNATETLSMCNRHLLLLHGHSGYANAIHYFVLSVLLVLLQCNIPQYLYQVND